MSQYPTPPQHYPPWPEPLPARNGLGTAGFVLGLLGLIFSFIPIIGVIAWPLVILGLVFAAIGLGLAIRRKASNKGLAISGLVLSIVGLVVCVLWVAGATRFATDLTNQVTHVAGVHYEVTGTAHDTKIVYSAFGDSGSATNQETAGDLPWSKDLEISGLFKGGSLAVTTGADGGTVTCRVIIDGKQTKASTASGQFATATCAF